MKVGDYVRTKDGIIGTLYGSHAYDENQIAILTKSNKNGVEYTPIYSKDDIIKSSPNIIDLIQEGDLVNNYIVGQVFYENQTIDNIKYLDLEGVNILICNDDIKSIVTKEQFESMEYKVKE